MQIAQGVQNVQKCAERAEACIACKRVRVICFEYLNIVGSLMALRFPERIATLLFYGSFLFV